MKYTQAKLVDDSGTSIINIEDMRESQAKKLVGKLFCPGDGCAAPLYMVHNPNDGGKTIFFRATNEEHIDNCIYKNENSSGGRPTGTSINGIYTEGQINDYVRNLHKDLNTPIEKKKRKINGPRKKKEIVGSDDEKKVIRGGRIVSGSDAEGVGNRGRMSRRYSVSESDIGAQIGVYGEISTISLDKYGQVHMTFQDERYSNIEILIGQVYKNLNEQEFNYLYKLKNYVENLIISKKRTYLVAGGLVTKYNNQLTVELQARYSFRINGDTILDLIRKGN
ncbi:hypothetical protein [Clostridium tunisiense]|uniref:hypothetical protein n=1 Tax=Clostridium tunisiense TaxID=219748 RepID=UPI0002ECF529|nr:hypothetical protein [Clostridium tunisiense]